MKIYGTRASRLPAVKAICRIILLAFFLSLSCFQTRSNLDSLTVFRRHSRMTIFHSNRKKKEKKSRKRTSQSGVEHSLNFDVSLFSYQINFSSLFTSLITFKQEQSTLMQHVLMLPTRRFFSFFSAFQYSEKNSPLK